MIGLKLLHFVINCSLCKSLKSDYDRIEIKKVGNWRAYHSALKSDYDRIEMDFTGKEEYVFYA